MGEVEVNSVSGLFPKENHEWVKWIQNGRAVRIGQKEKVLSLIDSLRTNPAESERIGLNLDSTAKIVEDFENPTIGGEENVDDVMRERTGYDKTGENELKYGHNDVTLRHGNESEQNNGVSPMAERIDAGRRMAADATRRMAVNRGRSDIRVYEEGLGTSHNEYSEYSERNRREAESERLVEIAKANGQYKERAELASLGQKYSKGTGESDVYINRHDGRVYKSKDPYAKSPMKGGV